MSKEQNLTDSLEQMKRLLVEKALLEKELRYVNYMLERQEVDLISFFRVGHDKSEYGKKSEELLRDLKMPAFEDLSSSEQERWHRILELEEAGGKLEMTVFFDYPRSLFLTVHPPEAPPQKVDVIMSIKKDIRNIGHPIILRAIERYKAKATTPKIKIKADESDLEPMDKKAIEKARARRKWNLEAVAKAILEVDDPGNPNNRFSPFNNIWEIYSAFRYGIESFSSVVRVVRSDKFKKLVTVSNQSNLVRQELTRVFPGVDHARLLKWFKERLSAGKLPKRGTAERFKNDFIAWSIGVSTESGKTYASVGKKMYEHLIENSPTEKQIEAAVSSAFALSMSSEPFPYDADIKNLVLVEKKKPGK